VSTDGHRPVSAVATRPVSLRRRSVAAAGLAGGLAACGVLPPGVPVPAAPPGAPAAPVPAEVVPAGAPREFRGAWVATVANIDWPSRPGLPAAQQRAELLALLDRAAAIGLNALVLQVRPAGDALYPSALEPWSEYLTGQQGRAPDAAWDPLATWVDEAHRRGLALHAWFNPYRARHASARTPLAAPHLAVRRPDLVRTYGDQLWMDPGEPDAAAHTLAVVADVLRRYPVDGVHIDDYFYPYPVTATADGGAAGSERPFPDAASWQRYQAGGGPLARDDWRRDNVNRLVQALQALVRRERPDALFGISPFGLGRPDLRPPGIQGFSQFHKLYADVELWCEHGWCDYLAPQLYWPRDPAAQAFGVLLDYWRARVPPGMALWPGLFSSRVGAADRPWPADELLAQIALLRARAGPDATPGGPAPEPSGHLHFSLAALVQDRDALATRLLAGPYATPARRPRPAGAVPT